jgi:hypothetical protein
VSDSEPAIIMIITTKVAVIIKQNPKETEVISVVSDSEPAIIMKITTKVAVIIKQNLIMVMTMVQDSRTARRLGGVVVWTLKFNKHCNTFVLKFLILD